MRTSFIFYVIFTFALSSCDGLEKRLDYSKEEIPTQLVVSGFAQGDETTLVQLSQSKGVLDQDFQFDFLESATMKLFENGQLVSTSTEMNSNNFYPLDHAIQSGKSYTLEVAHPQFENASVTTYVPKAVTGLSAEVISTSNDIAVDIQFNDSPDADYYQMVMVSSSNYGDNVVGWYTSSGYFDIDPFEGESYFYDDGLFTDEAFENGTAKFRINFGDYFYGSDPEFKILIYSCSEDYYLYYKSRQAYYNSDGGLFSQPVQIYSNIDKGLGIFGGFSTAEVTIEI